MNLREILSVECIRSPMNATDKEGAIRELVDLLAANDKISDADTLREAVWSREQTRTTGIGHGLAIPHGKCEGMKSLSMAIGKPETPMDFESMDEQPVELIVLLASPTDRTSDHIQALAQVSRMINNPTFREQIYAERDPEKIYELILDHTP